MKCIVIYMSQTTNTEKIARAIQAGVKQEAGHCDIAAIRDADPRGLTDYDLIGVGAPVMGMEPRNVGIFIENMRFVGGKHSFAFCTMGMIADYFFASVVGKMKKRGLTVIGMGAWYGAGYQAYVPKPFPSDGHPDETDLKEAEDFGREMVAHSQRISAGEIELIPPAPPFPKLDIMQFDKDIGFDKIHFDKMVKFHREKCAYPKCRLCMENCPMDGIDLTLEPPVIADPCTFCEFCVRICPTGAIDGDEYNEKAAKLVERDMSIIFLPGYEKAEAEGQFRRLVPVDEVGTGTPIYKARNHPHWIIGKDQT